MDTCAQWSFGAGLALLALGLLFGTKAILALGFAGVACSAFRFCSKNYVKRALENERFERLVGKSPPK